MPILYLFMYFLYGGPIGVAPGTGVPLGIPGLGFPLGRSWVRGSHWGRSWSGPLGPLGPCDPPRPLGPWDLGLWDPLGHPPRGLGLGFPLGRSWVCYSLKGKLGEISKNLGET